MFKRTAIAAAIAAACVTPFQAMAAETPELTEIRKQISEMKMLYEARIKTLENRLQEVSAKQNANQPLPPRNASTPASASPSSATASTTASPRSSSSASSTSTPATASANAFNPSISMVLGGTYTNLSKDPSAYHLRGFMTGGEIGPGSRSFNLGESELTFSANIDHIFSGQLTFALDNEDHAEVEEGFFQAKGLVDGVNLKAGRFFSSIGYMNNQHAHAWDFVDAPLAYQAFLGGQYKQDGVQVKWLAPTDTFIELGAEVGNGGSFPGTTRNKNGSNAVALMAHVGGDIGASSNWRTGVSYLHTKSEDREHTELNGNDYTFTGRSNLWIADAVYKWAPNGNASKTNLKLQGEYFRRDEKGTLTQDSDTGNYDNDNQSGWYVQGVYQFMPKWRTGLRYDKLSSGSPNMTIDPTLFPSLSSYSPKRTSVMLDYSPSEFSRLRLQYAQDKTRPDVTDNQIFLQYIMSLGTHGAHAY